MSMRKEDVDTTLVDYFVVAGFDPETGIVPCSSSYYAINSDVPCLDNLRPPLERSYEAKILHHFPQRRPETPFSNEVLALCMPRGLRFFTEKDVPTVPSIHTFANIKEDGSRVNGTTITFYEEVRDISICEAMSRLQTEHVKELTAHERVDRERTHLPPGTISGGTHTLPRGRRDKSKRISYYDGGSQNILFMSKTLCLITRLPLVAAPKAILKTFYEIIRGEQEANLPLESYIFWILNEIPLPSPGTSLKVSFLNTPIVVQRPSLLELPLFDDSLGSLFQFLPVDKFIKLFSCFLLEHQILICSKDYSKLMCVCEALTVLAFPFRWQMVYVPILPSSQLKFVEAPVPYVMGWCYNDSVPEFLFQSNVCVIDIDNRRSEFPEDLPLFPGFKELEQDVHNAIKTYSIWNEFMNQPVITKEEEPIVVHRPHTDRRRNEEWSMKRMSRSFDFEDDEGFYGNKVPPRPNRTPSKTNQVEDVLRYNSTLARVTEIARKVGVSVDVNDLVQEVTTNEKYLKSPICRRYFLDAKLNNAIRECVLHRIAGMLYSYEHFVVGGQGCADRESFEASRESLVCFDKASFLSDQPDSHLPFLAAFLETQMFTSFIDAKILSQWETPDDNLALFDMRIAQMRKEMGLSMVRTPTEDSKPPFAYTEELISKRENNLDYVVSGPHPVSGSFANIFNGFWPEMNTAILEGFAGFSPAPSPWKQRHVNPRPKQQEISSARPTSTYGGQSLIDDSKSAIAKQQFKFVEQLLRETKGKTKRMLVDKMGKEAVHLGHLDAGITGIEENTLVASFCDLLERIYAHGLVKKQGKSALWSYVLQHEDLEKSGMSSRTMSSSMLTPALAWLVFRKRIEHRGLRRRPSLQTFSPDIIPAPIILPSSNENDFGVALSDLVETIQRELNTKEDDPDAPAWSRSILRAANFICDKISSAAVPVAPAQPRDLPPRHETITGPVSKPYLPNRPISGHVSRQAMLRKSSSISDFTNPQWSGGRDGYVSVENSPRKRSQSRNRSPDGRVVLAPLPTSIAYDLKNVLRMTEIKTDIGYARAFVRLALERKLLHRHLSTLMGNQNLLNELYKPYAFSRCEDEKEQFLFHVLSLNAAQFRCFTNAFTKTKMDYQVVIVTSGWRGSLPAVWVEIEGSLAKSPQIKLPPGTPLFKFDHKNLGLLSNLRIGHVAGIERPPKWFLDYVIVRNEITGQTYRFPCSRWFGKGVDDGSLERLLIAEQVNDEDCTDQTNCPPGSPARGRRRTTSRSQTPQRERSPSTGRIPESTSTNRRSRLNEIQQMLGDSVNALVKYFHSDKKIRSELAHLLCGDRGLVNSIEQAFQLGRQDSTWTLRMFRQHFPWDYIEKVTLWFNELLRRGESEKMPLESRNVIMYALKLVRKISEKNELGKDGKFHVFVLLAIRDHTLSAYLKMMSWTPVTKDMYENPSFLRTPEHLSYLSRLLESLNEFQFRFEPSLTYGIT
ncbi:unnamed protein product [Auanema sp. JU1783]|nr:unnamed protein product [Auanema sp. JU1783]